MFNLGEAVKLEWSPEDEFLRARVRMKDGTAAELRPAQPEDRPRLELMFRSCSSETLYTRFLSPGLGVPLRYLNRLMEHRPPKILSLVAVVGAEEQSRVVALMNYVETEPTPRGEIAIVVLDDFQNRGLGLGMLQCLYALAKAQGVKNFVADIDADNRRVFHLIQRSGLPCKISIDQGVAHAEVEMSS